MKAKIIPMITYYSQRSEHALRKADSIANTSSSGAEWRNQTLTNLMSNCWSRKYNFTQFAHQWFGDLITCGTWADIWLNES